MNNYGTVTKCEKDFAFVKIKRSSMCGENCESCNLCAKKEIEIKAINQAQAKVGDNVELKMPEEKGFLAALLVYGTPVLLLLSGIIAGAYLNAVKLLSVIAVVVILVWYGILAVLEKNRKYSQNLTPIIIAVSGENND